MTISRRLLVAAAALAAIARPSRADTWPSRSITVYLPFPAGSATDAIARILTKEMGPDIGQSFVIQNRPGADGIIASEQTAHSPADGYSLMFASNTQLAANVSLYKKLPYDPARDFTPVGRFTTQPTVLVCRPDFPAKTVAELVAYAGKAGKPLSVGYGSASTQVVIAKLQKVADIALTPVAYRGIPPAMVDVIGGATDLAVADLGSGLVQARGGHLRAIAVTSETRSPLAPDWPAVSETYPGFAVAGWHAMVAPRGTPKPIADRLYQAGLASLQKPDVVQSLALLGVTPAPLDSVALGQFIVSEVASWADLIKSAGIEPQ